jgi:hypothetical protein
MWTMGLLYFFVVIFTSGSSEAKIDIKDEANSSKQRGFLVFGSSMSDLKIMSYKSLQSLSRYF